MNFLFNQIHPFERLNTIRISLCTLILILLAFGPYDSFYVDTAPFLFSSKWLPNLGIHFWTLKFTVMLLAICVAFDLKPKLCRPLFAMSYLLFSFYITCFGTTYWITNTHLVFFAIALCFEPLVKTPNRAQTELASFLIAFMITYIAALYFQAGLSKALLGGTAWFTEGKRIWTETLLLGTPFGKWLTQWPALFIAMSLGTALFELVCPFLFFFRSTQKYVAALAMLFHLSTFAVMGISFWFLWFLFPGLFFAYQSRSSTAPVCRL
jgi:hypothetical protein